MRSVKDTHKNLTGHTREPDPKHLEQKHKTTRKAATHERTPDRQTSRSHTDTHTHLAIGERCQSTDDTARLTPTLTVNDHTSTPKVR